MIKKILISLISIFILFSVNYGLRQVKLGYVDVEDVFNSYPGIEDIKKKLLDERKTYQIEIDKRKEEIALLEKGYQNNDRLSDEERQRRDAEIEYKKELLNDFIIDSNNKLTAFKEEMTKPIYLKIATVIQKVSAEKGFSFVFRKGNDILLFVDREFDITGEVKLRLKKELTLDERN